MRTTLAIRLVAAFGCAAALSAAESATAQFWTGTAGIEVSVEDAKGHGLAGAEVALDFRTDSDAGAPAPALTDAKGRLVLGGLAEGRWSLEVRKSGFMTYRADIVLSAGAKPEIVSASQHNVPGAVSTLRVRLGRARNAPFARSAVVVAPPATLVAAAPTAPTPVPAPQRAEVRSASPPAPNPAPAPDPALAAAPATMPPPPPASRPAPAPVPPLAPSPAPAPTQLRLTSVAAPMARSCYECRPGESALAVASTVTAGGRGCVAGLAERLRTVALAELESVRNSIGSGCALLQIDLPRGARFAGFRYEAEGPNAPAADCLPGRECPVGGGRFVGEPIVRREAETTTVLGLFEASADRRGTLIVYWLRSK